MKKIIWLLLLICTGFSIAQEIERPAKLIVEDVWFVNQHDTLRGTLVLPDTLATCPAMIMIHGSGRAERNIGYAKLLAAQGIAVLTYDKRGCGESGGKYNGNTNVSNKNLDLLAGDAIAGIRVLTSDPRIDQDKIGAWGISQAGWIAPIVANKTPVKFMVMLSCPTVTVVQELKFSQFAENNPDVFEQYSQQEIDAKMNKWAFSNIYFWMVGFKMNPRSYLEKLDIPVLWLYGGKDNSIPVHASLDIIQELDKSNFDVKIYPEYGHLLRPPDTTAVPAEHVNTFFIKWIRNL